MKVGISAQEYFKDVAGFKMGEFELPESVLKVCFKNDITPVIFPPTTSLAIIDDMLSMVDRIIITGGSDVGTKLYGEKPLKYNHISCMPTYSSHRDEFEIKLIKAAWKQRKPLLGLCRGLQILNVVCGGSLYQDLDLQFKPTGKPIQHFQENKSMTPTHSVTVNPTSSLHDALGDKTMVNSYHHQAIKKLGKGLKVTAKAGDGLIEGVETPDGLFQAIQWHPEQLWQNDPKQERIFKNFFQSLGQTALVKPI